MKRLRQVAALVVMVVWTVAPAFAQAPRDPCYVSAYLKGCLLGLARAAEGNARPREAWDYYMLALQQGSMLARGLDPKTGRGRNYERDVRTDEEIIQGLIALRNTLQPRPEIPAGAYAALQRGNEAIDKATTARDFVSAEDAFEAAVKLAPWWPDALLNLALVREKLGASFDAAQSFRLYLRADPSAADAARIQAKIRELESKQ